MTAPVIQGWQKQGKYRQDDTGNSRKRSWKNGGRDILWRYTVLGGQTPAYMRGPTLSCSLGEARLGEETFQEVINGLLPEDIRVIRTELEKMVSTHVTALPANAMKYHIDTRQKQDVFERRYSYHFPP